MERMAVENLRWPVTHEGTFPGVRGEKQLLTCFLQAYGHVMVSCLLKAAPRISVNKTALSPSPDTLEATSCKVISDYREAIMPTFPVPTAEERTREDRKDQERFVYLKVHDMRAH